jgi:hypothetical protein
MPRTPPIGRARSGKPIPSGHRPAASGLRPWPAAASLITAFVLGVAVAFGIGALATGPSASEENIADLQRAEAERDVAQIGTLTELARGSRDRLTPVLLGMADAIPVDPKATPGAGPTSATVNGWRDIASGEVTKHADAPSAGTAVNVARGGLRAAVQQVAAAVDAFAAAVDAAEPTKAKLLVLAGQQRTLALRTWSVAAIQLDVINIDAGNGHVHVQLPAGPESGAIAPDSSPEGSGRRR